MPDVRLTRPVEANAVFAIVPVEAVPVLQEVSPFYVWDERTSEVRWMTSFDTTEKDVDVFVEAVRRRDWSTANSSPAVGVDEAERG